MKHILIILALIVSNVGFSQIIPLGTDQTLCSNTQIGISSAMLDTTNIIVFNNPTELLLADDQYSDTISLGFNFTFYDSIYSHLCIGSNGILTFDTTNAQGYCPWMIAAPIPDPVATTTLNSIMGCYMDINYSWSGSCSYETIGVAPSRRFVVYYNSPAIYSCGISCWSIVIVLHETTNEIETFLRDKPICPNWNGGLAIQGLENHDGTIAHAVPGRNYPNQWNTMADGKKWTPNGLGSYAISTIPFNTVADTAYSISWGNTLGDTLSYSDTLYTYGQPGTTIGYFMGISSQNVCAGATVGLSDTSWINMDYQDPSLALINDFCSSGSGSISSMGSTVDSSYYWPGLSLYADTLSNLTAGSYPYVYTGNNGCQHIDTVVLVVQDTFDVQINDVICSYGTNGSIEISPDLPTSTYNWINPVGNVGNIANSLPTGVYQCFVSSSVGCSDTITFNLGYQGNIAINNILNQSESCYLFADGQFDFDIIGDSPPFNIYWQTSLNSLPIDTLSQGFYQLDIIDSLGCTYSLGVTIDGPTSALSHTVNITDELFGNDGTANLTVTNGNGSPFTYSIGGLFQSSNTFSNLTAGTYTSYVMDAFGCVDTSSFTINSQVSITELNDWMISISPNPTSGKVNVSYPEGTTLNFTITNSYGSIVANDILKSNYIDLSDYAAGFYFVEFKDEMDRRLVKKIIVQ